MVAVQYASRGVEMVHEWTDPVTSGGGGNVKSAAEAHCLDSGLKYPPFYLIIT